MSSKRLPLDLLDDILTEAGFALQFTAGFTYERFVADELTKRAVIWCEQVIGEASSQLPAEVKARAADIPWSDIVATRHKLVHHYSRINLVYVWSTVDKDLAPLIDRVRKLRDELLADLATPPEGPTP